MVEDRLEDLLINLPPSRPVLLGHIYRAKLILENISSFDEEDIQREVNYFGAVLERAHEPE